MTREEAILYLERMKMVPSENWKEIWKEVAEYRNQIIDMAIEALSANCTTEKPNDIVEQGNDVIVEPTDLISRKEVLDRIKAINSIPWGDDHGNAVKLVWSTEEVKRLIEKAPSADRPSGEWIPCSERLPKEKARVLTYDSMGDIVFGQYDKGRWYWEAEACADYWAKNDGVIAWMPLPKPYCPNCGAKMGGNK